MIVSIQDEDQIELVNKLMDKKNLLALKIGNKVYDKSFLSKNWKNAKTELLNVLSPKSFILNLNKPVKELILIIDN